MVTQSVWGHCVITILPYLVVQLRKVDFVLLEQLGTIPGQVEHMYFYEYTTEHLLSVQNKHL